MAKDTRFELRCTATEMALWKSVAANAGLSLADWIRSRLLSADTVPESPRAALVDEVQIEDRGGCLEATALSLQAFNDDPPSKPVRSRVRKKSEPIASDIPEIPAFEELAVDDQACADCGEFTCICRSLENVGPPSKEVSAAMACHSPSAELEALLPTAEEMAAVVGEVYLPNVSMPEDPSGLPDLTPEECERVLLRGSVALADGRFVVLDSPPASLFPVPAQRHKFKRHQKCTTEKCERGLMGPACTLCRMANAISF